MARIRTVKPEFWTSSQVMRLSPITRLAFIGMWNFCDDGGVHPADYFRLKAEVFPADPIGIPEVESMVKEMIEVGLIVEFSCELKTYWHVTGWRHQVIHQKTIKYPQYQSGSAPVARQSVTSSAPAGDECANSALTVHDQCATGTPRKGSRKGNRKRKGNNPLTPLQGELVDGGDSIPGENSPSEGNPLPEGESPYPDIDEIFAEWNAVEGVQHVRERTPDRVRTIKTRLKEKFFRENWREALVAVSRSDFCKGENSTNWKANFDWFVKPGKVQKIIERRDANGSRASPGVNGWRLTGGTDDQEEIIDLDTADGQEKLAQIAPARGQAGNAGQRVPTTPEIDF